MVSHYATFCQEKIAKTLLALTEEYARMLVTVAECGKKASLDVILHRLLSRMAGTKELPEVCKPNRDLRGRKSVHVQLEQ